MEFIQRFKHNICLIMVKPENLGRLISFVVNIFRSFFLVESFLLIYIYLYYLNTAFLHYKCLFCLKNNEKVILATNAL